jgi:type IV pilus modification protein PilV
MVPSLELKRRMRDERGLTMVEVLVALIIFAVGALAVAALTPLGSHSITKSGQNTRASELCSQVMERLLDTPYDDPDMDDGGHTDANNPYDGHYFVSWNVETNQPIDSCKRVTVTVRWPNSFSLTSVRLVAVSPESTWN